MSNFRAIILCGGKGERLKPFTISLPKALMPVGEYPILEIVIRQLVKYKITNITLAVNHQAKLIESFFGDGSAYGAKIDYSLESKPLGTVGPLSIITDLPDNFLVMNADILTDLNFLSLFKNHLVNKKIMTIAGSERKQYIDFGVLKMNNNNNLKAFLEKPTNNYLVSMGIYILNKSILKYIPKNKKYGFDNLIHKLINKKIQVNIKAHKKYWLDIGRPDDYIEATKKIKSDKFLFLNE